MLIARLKRKENIAEYILYIWQLEDLFRAVQFSPEAIYSQFVEPQQISAEEKQAVFFWYQDIVNLLRSEGKEEHGHIDHTLHLVKDLEDLHQALLKLPAGDEYRKTFAPLSEVLPGLKERLCKKEMGDVEFAMRSLYSVMLYRIKGDDGHKSYEEDVMALISPFVAKLAAAHNDVETGKMDIYKEK